MHLDTWPLPNHLRRLRQNTKRDRLLQQLNLSTGEERSAAVLLHSTTDTTRATSNLYTTRLLLLRLRLLCIYDSLLDIAGEAEEGLFDIDVAFG